MRARQTVVFLHGLGEGVDAWDAQRAALPSEVDSIAVDVIGSGRVHEAVEFTLAGAAEAVTEQIEQQGAETVHLCGLSLGAMIALQIALDHPERVASLTLAAGQVKPPRNLMAVQSAVIRLLPASVLQKRGARKDVMLAVLRAVSRADFTERLHAVSAPTLVLCGEKDRPNMPAARALAAGIRDAELQIIPGAGHQSHLHTPEAFATLFGEFLSRVR